MEGLTEASRLSCLVFEFSSLIMGLAVLVKLWTEPNKFWFIAFIFAVVMTTVVEMAGVREHQSYFYNEHFVLVIPEQPALGRFSGSASKDFPIFIAVSWAVIVFCMSRMCARLGLRWYEVPLVAGMIATSLDMAMDPVAANSWIVPGFGCDGKLYAGPAEGIAYWTWCVPKPSDFPNEFWFGVPIQNFYGWFLVVAVYMFFQGVAQQLTYDKPWKQQAAALAVVAVVSSTMFFSVLEYLMDLGSEWGMEILAGFMLLGFVVMLRAGKERTAYHFDGWAYLVIAASAIFSIATYLAYLTDTATVALTINTVVWVIFFVLVGLWVLLGKRMLGQPYP